MQSDSGITSKRKRVYIAILSILVLILIAMLIFLHLPHYVSVKDSKLTISVKATKRNVSGLIDMNDHFLHNGSLKIDFSSNVYAMFQNEYTNTMDVGECFICMQIPSSVADGVTYHHLPLTYGISCSVLASLFYGTDQLMYYCSSQDLIFSEIAVLRHLNLHPEVSTIESMGYIFRPTQSFDMAYALRNNLACKLKRMENNFIDSVESR